MEMMVCDLCGAMARPSLVDEGRDTAPCLTQHGDGICMGTMHRKTDAKIAALRGEEDGDTSP